MSNAPAAEAGAFRRQKKGLNVTIMLAHIENAIKLTIPSDRDAYRTWLLSLDEPTRALLFGVVAGGDTLRCPTNGRLYVPTHVEERDGCLWARCYWCDTRGTVRGEAGFDPDERQPHCYPLLEATHG